MTLEPDRNEDTVPRDFLTLGETAFYLGVSRWTAGRLLSRGAFGEVTAAGSELRFSVPVILRFLHDHTESPMTTDTITTALDEPPPIVGELPRLFAIERVAFALDLDPRKLKDLARQKPAPFRHYRFGAQIRMDQEQVDELLKTVQEVGIDALAAKRAAGAKALSRSRTRKAS